MLFINPIHLIISVAFSSSVTPCFFAISFIRYSAISRAEVSISARCSYNFPLVSRLKYSTLFDKFLQITTNFFTRNEKNDTASLIRLFIQIHKIIRTGNLITNMVSTIRYSANASSDHPPKQVPGILIIMNPKQPNLPTCSVTSTYLLFHLLSNPSLHLIANTTLGIIMTAIKISPKTLNHSILSTITNFDL
ncbi:hypothetical protein COPEUT_01913 [Coprococcus eutactus ATCC 27759]|nr:hypothetical protein COPEUT_01913 [Coprococcus eutactus ATCC 27759]